MKPSTQFLGLVFSLAVNSFASAAELPAVVSFNAHIRPIMSNTCFACHGPDSKGKRIRLDSFDAATGTLKSNSTLRGIVPGQPAQSEVFRRIMGTSDGDAMPPADFRHQLSDRDKALFGKWITQGAKYEKHWTYTPLKQPAVPKIDGTMLANPIDAFIRERLQLEQVAPSPEADRRTLLRRLSFDLTGLPPTPEELKTFLEDSSPDAYTKQVDRLMTSAQYGERMTSQWLDLVRFSDTVGFHGDQNHNIYPYRDYVIDSFNQNQPFDQFTREQLAGDLLPNPTPAQRTATGLIRMNMMTREGGAQAEEYLTKYTADRVRLIGTAWLGATTGCCECHNHKFDPFTIRDFYSLGAFFDDVRQWGVYADYDNKPNAYSPNPELDNFGNDHPFPPEQRVKSASTLAALYQRERGAEDIIAAQVSTATRNSVAYVTWAKTLENWLTQHPDGWQLARSVTGVSSKKTPTKTLDDQSVLFTGQPRKDDELTVAGVFDSPLPVVAIRLEVLPDAANGGSVGRASDGRFSLALSAFQRKPGAKDQPLVVSWALADRQRPTRYVRGRVPAYLNKVWQSGPEVWQFPTDEAKQPHTAIYHLAEPLTLQPGEELVLKLASANVGRVRVSVSPLVRMAAGMPAVSARLREDLGTQSAANSVAAAYFLATVPKAMYGAAITDRLQLIAELYSGYAMTMVADAVPEAKRRVTRILPRGNWQDKSGAITPPGVPEFLISTTLTPNKTLTRLDLANWLTSTDNGLTPRHFVNYTWKQFFGRGLSSKLDDLGSQGEWPSHPELLDWLASEFVGRGWDRKQIVRLIVTSQTYRQSAVGRKDLAERDPENRLLAQQTPRRLDAEAIRDNALSVAGLLTTNYVGGPSVLPYQPAGHWSIISPPGRPYVTSVGPEQYRRGLYIHWQRTFLHPMLTNFDAPLRDECTADRPLSNSPQQALTLLNDPSFLEAAIALADKVLAADPAMSAETFATRCVERTIGHSPTPDQVKRLATLAKTQSDYFAKHPDEATVFFKPFAYRPTSKVDPATLAGYAQVCRVVLNLHETITRY